MLFCLQKKNSVDLRDMFKATFWFSLRKLTALHFAFLSRHITYFVAPYVIGSLNPALRVPWPSGTFIP